MDIIPIELFANIFKFFDLHSIINFSMLNKRYRLIIKSKYKDMQNEYYLTNYNKLCKTNIPINICNEFKYLSKHKLNKIFNFINDKFICYDKFTEMCFFQDETIYLMFHYKNTMNYINKSTQNDLLIYDLGKAYENSYKNIIDNYIQMSIPLDIIHNIIRWSYIKTFVFKNIIKVMNSREAYILIEHDYTKKELDMIIKLINNKIIDSQILYNISNITDKQIDNIINNQYI